MAISNEDREIAIRVIDEVSGSPDSGAIAELIKELKNFDKSAAKEVRVVEAKETR
jgi:hypothetical protein